MNACKHKNCLYIFNFTLLELLVVIGIIMILVSSLIPAINKAKNYAKRIQCVGNLKTINTAILSYCSDYNDYMPAIRQDNPAGSHWYQSDFSGNLIYYIDVRAYTQKRPNTPAQCPVNPTALYNRFPTVFPNDLYINYGGNRFLGGNGSGVVWPRRKLNSFRYPSFTLSFADATLYYLSASTADFDFRHINKVNCLFMDGHINPLGITQIPLSYSNRFWDALP